MTADAEDRFVVAVEERRRALIDVIRRARRQITLSLFRCNDEEFLDELRAATVRGVAIEVLMTSRSKGGERRRQKLLNALDRVGASVSVNKLGGTTRATISGGNTQVTALALTLGSIAGGSIIVEYIFTYPGMGYLLYQGLINTDYALIQGIVYFLIVGVALAVLIMDLLYPLIDPRITYERK